MRMKRDRIKPFPRQAKTGIRWASLISCLMSISAGARPNCSPSSVQPRVCYAPKACSLLPMWSCIPGSKSNCCKHWKRSKNGIQPRHCLPRLNARCMPNGKAGWVIRCADPGHPYASFSSGIIWQGIGLRRWPTGSWIMAFFRSTPRCRVHG